MHYRRRERFCSAGGVFAELIVIAWQGKVVPSYGPTNQDMSFSQTEDARMAVSKVGAG
jgi:hypothetical protein